MASNMSDNDAVMEGTEPFAQEMVSRFRIRILLSALGVRFQQERKTPWDVITFVLFLSGRQTSWKPDLRSAWTSSTDLGA
jgi:hypothetical protein